MTVISNINAEIKYKEVKTIDEEDMDHVSTVYELDVFTQEEADESSPMTISVVIGKPKYLYTSKNVVFFPIYAVSKQRVRAQIGIFEIESAKVLNVYKNGEIDVERLQAPVLYSFVTPAYLAKIDADPKLFQQSLTPIQEEPDAVEPVLEEERQLDHLSLKTKPKDVSLEKTASQKTIAEGIFDQVATEEPLDPLPEETEEDSAKQKQEYKDSARNTWIEKYMKNNNYRIHENEGGGDCFFAVVRDAFAQLGKKTSVEKLRAALADELTDDVFQEYRAIYLGFQDEIMQLDQEMEKTKVTIGEYKKRVKGADTTAADTKSLIEQASAMSAEYNAAKKKKAETEALQKDYAGYIKDVDTLEKMRAYIKTPNFWADTWAISTLERVLNVKFVILSETAFADSDLDGVVQCGEIDKRLQERQQFTPDYYIITSFTGNHYRLVSYKQRKIMVFREVPYDIKVLILNKCLAKTSGPFFLIQDFRNWKTRFGIDEDEGAPEDYSETPGSGDLFEQDVTFVFYARSDKSVKPGKGDGEKIPAERTADFATLGSKAMTDWRKKLDDEWLSPVFIDQKKWASVEHFMQAVKYRKGHPDIYDLFSLDSVVDTVPGLNSDVKIAKAFKGLKPSEDADKKKAVKVKVIAPDLDFDSARVAEEREKAVKAKFEANEELKTVLRLTKKALLLHKNVHDNTLEPDTILMKVRMNLM
jgi:hypothetical protein